MYSNGKMMPITVILHNRGFFPWNYDENCGYEYFHQFMPFNMTSVMLLQLSCHIKTVAVHRHLNTCSKPATTLCVIGILL